MTNRERFKRVLDFQPVDRLPVIEWAGWWDKTIDRWRGEGLRADLRSDISIRDYFGLDLHCQAWVGPRASTCPDPPGHGRGIVSNRQDYLAIKPHLYPDPPFDMEWLHPWAEKQRRGECVIWLTLEGPFWYPRTLFGIEPHMYAFYDEPDLMLEMNEDLLRFNLKVYEAFCDICVPDFMTFAEDMSYNHGPMLSRDLFDRSMAPFYEQITPVMHERGTVPFVDTDGDVTDAIKWFTGVGISGFLPLERMAGVDVSKIRQHHPRLNMLGAFDKTVMHLGEERIRQEFERLLPVMRQGGYIPSVDHQTPPEVSMQDYWQYVRLLKEYCAKACQP